MFKIYIDSSKRNEISVQLLSAKGEVLGHKEGSIDIVKSIHQLLTEKGAFIKDVAEFKVNKGPGSFTGLKKGVTASNILNWATGKKSVEQLDLPEYGAQPNIFPTKYTK